MGLPPPTDGAAAVDGAAAASSPPDGDGAAASAPWVRGGGGSHLIPLARQLADGEGRLLLTFATAVYDPLCRNFVAHLRRLGMRHYLLATFTRAYHATLTARGETPYLHDLPQLASSNGSDVFASREFFLINSARYAVLTRLLRAGLHVFACDLDVAILRDPLPAVWAMPHDLLLQSDARDGTSLAEASPFLLRDRLHLPARTLSVTYVNGGVFFARGTHAVARLFEDTWAMASQDLGTLNEQDCLNRMLLASSLRWAPLPPRLFPNGYVYFRRPLPPAGDVHGNAPRVAVRPVLVHCNWINGIAAKRYLLREALVWAGDADAEEAAALGGSVGGGGECLLAYAVGTSAEERSLGGQVRALCAALALAAVSNRTLVMPRFYVLPPRGAANAAEPAEADGAGDGAGDAERAALGAKLTAALPERAAAEARAAQEAGLRGFTYLFEYAPFLRHFPRHRESSVLRATRGARLAAPLALPSALAASQIDDADSEADAKDSRGEAAGGVSDDEGDGAGDGAGDSAEDGERADSGPPVAARALREWLETRHAAPLLRVHGLHRVTTGSLFAHTTQRAAFEARLRKALQPAPELRVISHHIVTKVHAYLHRLAGERASHPAEITRRKRRHERQLLASVVGRGGGAPKSEVGGAGAAGESLSSHATHDFNCLHVTAAELASPNRLRAAASTLPLDVPTLLVRETGDDEPPAVVATTDSPSEPTSAVSGPSWLRAPLPPAASKVFAAPMHVGTFYPFWDAVEVDDAVAGRTLAYDLIQQLVCAAARHVHGNAGSEFVHNVCFWRRSVLFSKLLASRRGGSSNDVCSTLWEG